MPHVGELSFSVESSRSYITKLHVTRGFKHGARDVLSETTPSILILEEMLSLELSDKRVPIWLARPPPRQAAQDRDLLAPKRLSCERQSTGGVKAPSFQSQPSGEKSCVKTIVALIELCRDTLEFTTVAGAVSDARKLRALVPATDTARVILQTRDTPITIKIFCHIGVRWKGLWTFLIVIDAGRLVHLVSTLPLILEKKGIRRCMEPGGPYPSDPRSLAYHFSRVCLPKSRPVPGP